MAVPPQVVHQHGGKGGQPELEAAVAGRSAESTTARMCWRPSINAPAFNCCGRQHGKNDYKHPGRHAPGRHGPRPPAVSLGWFPAFQSNARVGQGPLWLPKPTIRWLAVKSGQLG